ncbi:hypothetical protein [Marinomonas spartinae]|uniref:hypothetical protein n=1 Tax=Marinomonas spartinae TaxID=1792290 RepID=UPI0018F26D3B|nr:hypothetical protein [Marinomonas spartinae]MBJ7553428.1 hypothetical protein [Marinomonas spartinae]
MKYFVKQFILGKTSILPIEASYFTQLQQSQRSMVAAKAIEEKYDLMISNYMEFEKELLLQITEQVVLNKDSYDEFYKIRTILNRRIVNLLTSTKLYYDQMQRQVRLCDFNNEGFSNTVLSYFSREYDDNFEYRFMDNLRNYVQHCGLAIHSFSLPSQWEGDGDSRTMRNGIKIYSTREELGQDPKFSKRPVFTECTDKINLVKSIRKYVEKLSLIHDEIRTLIEGNLSESRNCIEKVISEYKAVNNNDTLGVYAYSVDSGDPLGDVTTKVPLLLDWDNVRLNLVKKNKKLTNNSKQYISGKCL